MDESCHLRRQKRYRHFGYNLTQFGNTGVEGSSDFCPVKIIYAKDDVYNRRFIRFGKSNGEIISVERMGTHIFAAK